jgi:hypothetical protein
MPQELQRLQAELEPLGRALSDFAAGKAAQDTVNTILGVLAGVVCALVLMILVSALVHYVAEAALLRMVDGYEATGEKVGWRAGLRLGWSRTAWRLFLIDLCITLPVILLVAVLVGCMLVPLWLVGSAGGLVSLAGGVAMVGLIFLFVLGMILLSVALAMVRELAHRRCALQGLGVVDSLRGALDLLRARFKQVFLMWLILFGITLGTGLVLLPVFLIAMGLGLLAGGAAGFGLFLLMQAGSQLTAVLVAIAVGIFLCLLVATPPIAFLRGLVTTYFSTAWTLAYRELGVPSPAPSTTPG